MAGDSVRRPSCGGLSPPRAAPPPSSANAATTSTAASANSKAISPRLADGRPVETRRQLNRGEVEQATALDGAIFAVLKRQPIHHPLQRVDDQQLVHLVSGVERELAPRLIARRDGSPEPTQPCDATTPNSRPRNKPPSGAR